MENIETILTNCIMELKAGRTTVDECLRRYPAERFKLEPLLKIALYIKRPVVIEMPAAEKQSVRTALLSQIKAEPIRKSTQPLNLFTFGIPSRLVWARVAVFAVIGILMLSILGGGTAYASQSSLPGELLYPVKIEVEKIRSALALNYSDKAALDLVFAQTRLNEILKLAGENDERAQQAADRYQTNLEDLTRHSQLIQNQGDFIQVTLESRDALKEQVREIEQRLDTVTVVPASLTSVESKAFSAQLIMVTALADRDNLEAARINIEIMQNRLQRAEQKATNHEYQKMQAALLQYQSGSLLGEKILEQSRNTHLQDVAITQLSHQAVSGFIGSLIGLAQNVPQEYRSSLEYCQQLTQQFKDRAEEEIAPPESANPDTERHTGSSPDPGVNPTPDSSAKADSGSGSGSGSDSGSGSNNPSSPDSGSGTGNGNAGGSDSGSGSGTGDGSGAGSNPDSGSGAGSRDGSGAGSTPDSGSGAGSGDGSGSGSTPDNGSGEGSGDGSGAGSTPDSGSGAGSGDGSGSGSTPDSGSGAGSGDGSGSGSNLENGSDSGSGSGESDLPGTDSNSSGNSQGSGSGSGH